MTPAVSIIILNWNGLSDTRECLQSLSRITYPNAAMLVVDNGSKTDESGALRAAFPEVTVIATGKNLGFTGGNNVGIDRALAGGADYVLLLNNDTVVDPGYLEPLVQALEDHPDVGMAVSKIYYHASPEEIWFAGAECTFDAASLERGIPAWHPPYPEHQARMEPYETQIATACCLLVRADVMRRLGGFDDRYFAYYEDVELNLRAAALGYRRLVVPASRIWHKVSQSSGGQESPNVAYYCLRNTALLAATYAGEHPASGRVYYRAFARKWLKEADWLGHFEPANPAYLVRAQAIVSAVLCARLGCYGRRENHSWIDKLSAIWVSSVSFRRAIVRPYWFLNAHLFQRFRRASKVDVL